MQTYKAKMRSNTTVYFTAANDIQASSIATKLRAVKLIKKVKSHAAV